MNTFMNEGVNLWTTRFEKTRQEGESPFNHAVTIVNVLDELDWVVAGYGEPTPQFLYSLNAFTESYVLNESLMIPLDDLLHLNLISPLFKRGRPLLDLLIRDSILTVGISPISPAIGPGKIVFAFASSNHSEVSHTEGVSIDPRRGGKYPEFTPFYDEALPDPHHVPQWAGEYLTGVDPAEIRECIPRYRAENPPKSLRILTYGGNPGYANRAVAMFARRPAQVIKDVLSVAKFSLFHPLLPVYAARARSNSFPAYPHTGHLYRRLADAYRIKVQDLEKYTGYKAIPVPPLVAVLLGRSKTRDDIPQQLRSLRNEFSHLRRALSQHEKALHGASSLGEQLDAVRDFEAFWAAASRAFDAGSRRLIYRIWDVVKESDLRKMFAAIVDELIRWDEERVVLSRFKGFSHLWTLIRRSPPSQNQLRHVERLFGKGVSNTDWERFVRYATKIEEEIRNRA